MLVKRIQLWNFKSYEEANFSFEQRIVVISGKNGSGKTNLLDALHYLCLTRSSIQKQDADCIRFGSAGFVMAFQVEDENHKAEKINIGLNLGEKKVIRVNGGQPEKITAYLGRYPVVLISPDDIFLIHEGNEERRSYTDMNLCQYDTSYLRTLSKYKQLLTQRNELLKYFAESQRFDALLLDSYTDQMLPLAQEIFEKRKAYFEVLQTILEQTYAHIAGKSVDEIASEWPSVQYKSHLFADDFETAFRQNVGRDRAAQRTTMGVHKDEVIFTLAGQPLKYFGSQGQQKTFILALKLANFELLKQKSGKMPLLLLDDIFDKLDDERILKLIKLIQQDKFGQIFITDARPERTSRFIIEQGLVAQHIILGG
jgi:DNA replication and repair protein RecF